MTTPFQPVAAHWRTVRVRRTASRRRCAPGCRAGRADRPRQRRNLLLGAVFFAPLGMVIGAAIWRKRGRVLSMVGHWLAALIGVAAVIVVIAAAAAAVMPQGSWNQFQRTMDSATAAAATQPRRATLEPTAPRQARRAALDQLLPHDGCGARLRLRLRRDFYGRALWHDRMDRRNAARLRESQGRWPGQSHRG